MIRKTSSFIGSWSLYLVGDLISKPMSTWECCASLYPAYNKLMCVSSDIQDWGGAGPWKVPDKEKAP